MRADACSYGQTLSDKQRLELDKYFHSKGYHIPHLKDEPKNKPERAGKKERRSKRDYMKEYMSNPANVQRMRDKNNKRKADLNTYGHYHFKMYKKLFRKPGRKEEAQKHYAIASALVSASRQGIIVYYM